MFKDLHSEFSYMLNRFKAEQFTHGGFIVKDFSLRLHPSYMIMGETGDFTFND